MYEITTQAIQCGGCETVHRDVTYVLDFVFLGLGTDQVDSDSGHETCLLCDVRVRPMIGPYVRRM